MSIEEIIKNTIAEQFAAILPLITPKAESLPEIMTFGETYRYCRVSNVTLRNWIKTKNFPEHRPGAGDPRYFRSEIDAWIRTWRVGNV